MTRPRPHIDALLLAVVLALSACTPSASEPRIPSPPVTATPSASTSPTPSPTPTTSPTPIPSPTPSPSPTPDPVDEISALWQDFTESHLSRHQNPAVEVDLQPWLSRDVIPSRTIGLDLPTYEFPNSPRPTGEVKTYPRITVDGNNAELTDCVIYRVAGEGPDGIKIDEPDNSRNWEATLKRNPNRGWIITAISAAGKSDTNCVPPQLRRRVLEAYDEFVHARDRWWSPIDPDHPDLPDYVTATHLARLQDEIMPPQIRANAVGRFDRADTSDARVADIGLGTATVEECTESDPDVGLFDASTDERLIEAIDDDPKTNTFYVTEMIAGDDGRWRVDANGGGLNVPCKIGEVQ